MIGNHITSANVSGKKLSVWLSLLCVLKQVKIAMEQSKVVGRSEHIVAVYVWVFIFGLPLHLPTGKVGNYMYEHNYNASFIFLTHTTGLPRNKYTQFDLLLIL